MIISISNRMETRHSQNRERKASVVAGTSVIQRFNVGVSPMQHARGGCAFRIGTMNKSLGDKVERLKQHFSWL
jgi:hypothetical protein